MTWYEYIVSRNIYEMANFFAALTMTGKFDELKREYEADADNLFCGAENITGLMAEDIEAWLSEPVNFKGGKNNDTERTT